MTADVLQSLTWAAINPVQGPVPRRDVGVVWGGGVGCASGGVTAYGGLGGGDGGPSAAPWLGCGGAACGGVGAVVPNGCGGVGATWSGLVSVGGGLGNGLPCGVGSGAFCSQTMVPPAQATAWNGACQSGGGNGGYCGAPAWVGGGTGNISRGSGFGSVSAFPQSAARGGEAWLSAMKHRHTGVAAGLPLQCESSGNVTAIGACTSMGMSLAEAHLRTMRERRATFGRLSGSPVDKHAGEVHVQRMPPAPVPCLGASVPPSEPADSPKKFSVSQLAKPVALDTASSKMARPKKSSQETQIKKKNGKEHDAGKAKAFEQHQKDWVIISAESSSSNAQKSVGTLLSEEIERQRQEAKTASLEKSSRSTAHKSVGTLVSEEIQRQRQEAKTASLEKSSSSTPQKSVGTLLSEEIERQRQEAKTASLEKSSPSTAQKSVGTSLSEEIERQRQEAKTASLEQSSAPTAAKSGGTLLSEEIERKRREAKTVSLEESSAPTAAKSVGNSLSEEIERLRREATAASLEKEAADSARELRLQEREALTARREEELRAVAAKNERMSHKLQKERDAIREEEKSLVEARMEFNKEWAAMVERQQKERHANFARVTEHCDEDKEVTSQEYVDLERREREAQEQRQLSVKQQPEEQQLPVPASVPSPPAFDPTQPLGWLQPHLLPTMPHLTIDQLHEHMAPPSPPPCLPTKLSVLLDAQKWWPAVWSGLPAPTYGLGAHTQHFGLLFGDRNTEGVLQLSGAELCPEPFVWDPYPPSEKPEVPDFGRGRTQETVAAIDTALRSTHDEVSSLAVKLEESMHDYLKTTFGPWTHGLPAAAWLVCNDGEAFALSKPLIEQAFWVKAKSTSAEPLVEVYRLGGPRPQRLIFDVRLA
eukprot:TRINITY_DN6455_c0_g1_i4.p1 TRINITY_DN6455_c0_g1~~TRINITY_DN6455_c0_g1_i4.p1  ORF type:complete len:898 (+),score=187.61 TRINITY_DN6455_c0_g1_i4:61-2694(+)